MAGPEIAPRPAARGRARGPSVAGFIAARSSKSRQRRGQRMLFWSPSETDTFPVVANTYRQGWHAVRRPLVGCDGFKSHCIEKHWHHQRTNAVDNGSDVGINDDEAPARHLNCDGSGSRSQGARASRLRSVPAQAGGSEECHFRGAIAEIGYWAISLCRHAGCECHAIDHS